MLASTEGNWVSALILGSQGCWSTALARSFPLRFGCSCTQRSASTISVGAHGDEMSIFDFFLAALSLAPVGLFLLFWRMFPRDRGVHPIYRESGIEMIDNGTEVQDAIARRLHMREVERKGK